MAGEWYGEHIDGLISTVTTAQPTATGGFTSAPVEQSIEPEGALVFGGESSDESSDADDESSGSIEFTVKANFDAPFPDVKAFGKSLDEGFQIFMDRRKRYGNHLDNAVRFPLEDIAGLYLKCVRFVRMVEAKYDFTEPLDDDTLIDQANYAHLIRSRKDG